MQIEKTGEKTNLQLGDLIVVMTDILNLGIYFTVQRDGAPLIFDQPNQENPKLRFCAGGINVLEGYVNDLCGFGIEKLNWTNDNKSFISPTYHVVALR